MAHPYEIPGDHYSHRILHTVLEESYGLAPYYTRMGGSLPVCGFFLEHLKAYTAVLAFGLMDENQHAPDEFFRLGNFERGQVAYCRLLEELGNAEDLGAGAHPP